MQVTGLPALTMEQWQKGVDPAGSDGCVAETPTLVTKAVAAAAAAAAATQPSSSQGSSSAPAAAAVSAAAPAAAAVAAPPRPSPSPPVQVTAPALLAKPSHPHAPKVPTEILLPGEGI